MQQIVLVGFMGAGKTTIGHELATILQLPLIDTDQLIEERVNQTIPEIFEQYGESYFRELEAQVLASLNDQEGIISTGGGIVLQEATRQQLKNFQHVVYLTVPFKELVTRIKNDSQNLRPLFLNHTQQDFQKVYESRASLYEAVSTIEIENTGKIVETIANEIIDRVGV